MRSKEFLFISVIFKKKTKAFSIPHVVASSRSLFIGNFIVAGTVDPAIEIRGCYFMFFCFKNIYVLLVDFDVIEEDDEVRRPYVVLGGFSKNKEMVKREKLCYSLRSIYLSLKQIEGSTIFHCWATLKFVIASHEMIQ